MRKPTFVLKPQAYKTDKLYAQVPHDGSCDLSIGSYVGNGTRVNKYGLIEAVPTDTPRIDYLDGVGLLLEPARKNLVTTSTGVSGWSFSATLTANAGVAPDGEYTASLIQDTSGTAISRRKTHGPLMMPQLSTP